MSYAPRRSMNGSLADGMTDGTYKKLNPNRGGLIERTTEDSRQMLNHDTIGYQEGPTYCQPDGTDRFSTGDIPYSNALRHQG